MGLPNVKILICWPSRMQIYGFVENHTFLEQFVSMGVPAQFSNLGVTAQFSNLGVTAHFWSISLVHVLLCNFFGLYGFGFGPPLIDLCLLFAMHLYP